MTILPKKKQTKEKNDPEATSDSLSSGHSSTNDPSRATRRPTSPPHWIPPNSRDDRLPAHEPGNRRYQEDYSSHDGGANHNKRRHRSSPHRSVRKHRHDRGAERTTPGSGRASPPSQTGPSQRSPGSPSVQPVAAQSDDPMEEGTGYNSEDEYGEVKHPENIEELERWFEDSLRAKRGLVIKKMSEDGACLFRSVADQVFGDQEMHSVVRRMCVDYMAKNADFFKHYVTEEFGTYLKRKRTDSCHGNHVEMQALSELYNRPIEVYQYGPEPINTFHGAYKTDNDPIRISYHRNVHYNSIIDPYKATVGVGLGLPGFEPGLADRNLMGDAMRASEESHLEKTMLEDKMRETDWELTQESMEEQVARESYLQWLRDNEKRASRQNLTRTASATCSSARESASPRWDATVGSPDARTSRGSPRSRSANNSGPNSPNRTDAADAGPNAMELQTPGTPPPGPSSEPSVALEGAVGGPSVRIPETNSLMNDLYCLSAWDEQDILAQVIAQSEREYYNSLKRTSEPTCSHACTSSSPCCSGTVLADRTAKLDAPRHPPATVSAVYATTSGLATTIPGSSSSGSSSSSSAGGGSGGPENPPSSSS